MAITTYIPIGNYTLSSQQASVTFTVPQTYSDLVVVMYAKNTPTDTYTKLIFNADNGTNYSRTQMVADGSTFTSGREANYAGFRFFSSSSANLDNCFIYINDYSSSSKYKTLLTRENTPTTQIIAQAGLWRSTAAITSIELTAVGQYWATGSTFTVYGIA